MFYACIFILSAYLKAKVVLQLPKVTPQSSLVPCILLKPSSIPYMLTIIAGLELPKDMYLCFLPIIKIIQVHTGKCTHAGEKNQSPWKSPLPIYWPGS